MIPYGYCHCGCGQKTTIADFNAKESPRHKKIVKGEPRKFIKGHAKANSGPDYIVDDNGCWVWQKCKSSAGYGYKAINCKQVSAHRHYFEKHNGPIPKGLHIDHLCRNRACVNPSHLEAVTSGVNSQRGLKTKLTPSQIIEIRDFRANGLKLKELANMYGVNLNTIFSICKRTSWKNI